jgi:hypothetical protein
MVCQVRRSEWLPDNFESGPMLTAMPGVAGLDLIIK